MNITSFIQGGSQERNMRGGTENIYGIVGLSKALDIALNNLEKHQIYIQGLKSYLIQQLESKLLGVEFNGDAKGKSHYTILNVLLPHTNKGEMLLYNLDIAGISVSAGSACSSGSNIGSYVLKNIKCDMLRPSIRFSFCKFNTKEEIDYCVNKLVELFESN